MKRTNLAIYINPLLRNNAKSYMNVKNTLLDMSPTVFNLKDAKFNPKHPFSELCSEASDDQFVEDINRVVVSKNLGRDTQLGFLSRDIVVSKLSLADMIQRVDDNGKRLAYCEAKLASLRQMQISTCYALKLRPSQ